MTEDEMKKRILLLMNGLSVQEYNHLNNVTAVTKTKPATTAEPAKTVKISKLELGLKKVENTAAIPATIAFEGEHHFPGYQYLGPGTKFKTRQALGIEPINDLDRVAYFHDSQYSRTGATNSSGLPVMPVGRSPLRGVADLGAGSAMLTAAYNPWADLGWTDRGYAAGAGSVLIGQGILRLHPLTMAPMAIIDAIFY